MITTNGTYPWSFVIYSVANNQVMVVTFEVMTSAVQLGTIISTTSLSVATLYQDNHDRKQKLWNIASTARYIHVLHIMLLHVNGKFIMWKLKSFFSLVIFVLNVTLKDRASLFSFCLVKPLYEACLVLMKSTIRRVQLIHKNAHCLLKNTSTKHSKYVVNQKLDHFDDISFRELFGQIRVVLYKIRFEHP
jgi:hypothetical protein